MSVSNLRKISGPANLDFFLGLHKLDLYHKPEKNPGDKLKKKSRFAGPEIFLGLNNTLISQDLDFQKSRCRLKDQYTAVYLTLTCF